CYVLYAAAGLSSLCVTLLLTANRSRPRPLWSPVSPQPASRVGGGHGGGRWGLMAGSAPGRGLGMGQGKEAQQGELKITLSDLINGCYNSLQSVTPTL
ncbi:hypothetical protein KUCAC02_013105, partial [Chaenocephalus aceratus]